MNETKILFYSDGRQAGELINGVFLFDESDDVQGVPQELATAFQKAVTDALAKQAPATEKPERVERPERSKVTALDASIRAAERAAELNLREDKERLKAELAKESTAAARQLLQQLLDQSTTDEEEKYDVADYEADDVFPFAELVELAKGFMKYNAALAGKDVAALLSSHVAKIDLGTLEEEIDFAGILTKACKRYQADLKQQIENQQETK